MTGDMDSAFAELRPLPRITIEAFCVRPETGLALQRAAADRRLSKAQITVRMGTIAEAAAHFAQSQTPNLVIVESGAAGRDLLGELEALAQVCDAGTKVVVCGPVNDVALYRELLRQGVSEYLVAPFSPVQAIEAMSALYSAPDAPPVGRTVAVVGAKGGTGASTIAHNLAWIAAEELGIATLLVDLDVAFGTAGLDFNQDPAQGIADAIASPDRLDDVLLERLLVRLGEKLQLLAAPATLDREWDLAPDALDTVLDAARANAPLVVVDLPHLWTPWAKRVLVQADEIVIVAAPDLASLRNTKALLDALAPERPHDRPARLVLNGTGLAKRPEIPIKEFAAALGRPPEAVIAHDARLFGAAANAAQMIVQAAPRNPASDALRQLARAVSGRHAAPDAKKAPSVLSFLTKKAG